jgi:hypothetical protein
LLSGFKVGRDVAEKLEMLGRVDEIIRKIEIEAWNVGMRDRYLQELLRMLEEFLENSPKIAKISHNLRANDR